MKHKSFILLVLTLALLFIFAGCRAAEEAPPAPTEVAEPATPVEVTESFYDWYLDYIGDPGTEAMKNPLVDGAYRSSPYLTADYVAKVDTILASFDQGGYDPILQAQDIPQSFSVEEDYTAENDACVIVHEVWEGSPAHDLTVDLVKQEGAWKINNIRPGNPRTPDGVTRLFYDWYIDYVRNQGNPLVDEAYKTSPYLSPDFVAQVEETLAGFEHGGYDPILLAQDIPVNFFVETPVIDGDHASVVVQQYWGGNPQPRPITVHLQAVDGRWQIVDVTADEPTAVEPAAPAEVVQAFYDWYLAYIGDPASEEFRNPLVDKAYHQSQYLTADFIVQVDELLATFEGGGYDPFLCAQAIPTEITTGVTFMNGETPGVIVTSSFPNQVITVDLRQVDQEWQISNIICNMTPEGTAKAFYTWYLGYMGDRASAEFRNPLVDGAYKDTLFLSDALVQRVDETLASFDEGGFDPFLLAQDIPQSFSVDPGPAENTAVVHLQFGPDSVRHLLLTFADTYPPRIDTIEEATQPYGEALAPSVNVPEVDTSDWQTFSDEEYGFAFRYPADWVIEEVDLTGPGMPDDWPVVRALHLMPPDVAEQLAASSGAPDPNAPVIVAPFLVEVTVGDETAFNRVYVAPLSSETAVFNGHTATVQRQDPGYAQYVFRHPADSNVWIVVTDWVSGFPGREAQAEAVAGVLQPLLNSFTFSQ